MTNTERLDLNLLRVFDAVYRARNISRAAGLLGLSQPATSQALTRLRLALRDHLFERAPGGVRPTERAQRLAPTVARALAMLDDGLAQHQRFDPRESAEPLRLHLTDIGEARFLPRLAAALRREAPAMQIQSSPWPQSGIAAALDSGELHFAIGYLPAVTGTQQLRLLEDRYALVLRAGHPRLAGRGDAALSPEALRSMDFVVVRSHSQTQRMLQVLRLEQRIRMLTSSFLALPGIVRATDLGVLMPRQVAEAFEPRRSFRIVDLGMPMGEFHVSLHWSRRHEQLPMLRWARELIRRSFGEE